MPKGPVFYQPPEVTSDDEINAAAANPNLDFNSILTGMGGGDFLSSGNESEEEKKEVPVRTGVRVFRPNLSASHPYREDASAASTVPTEDPALSQEFNAHLSNPNTVPFERESDSDTAPCAAIADEKEEETDEERQLKDQLALEESARLASSEDEQAPRYRPKSAQEAAKIAAT